MFKRFAPGAIAPEGWYRRQLEIQAAGLSGNLDKVWPDIRDSAWIGGDRDGWERVPYWLDGFIPLAYSLKDPDMIARADRYVNAIIDRQQEDGWICPCTVEERPTYDSWPIQLISKVLAQYAEFTGSRRASKALYRTLRCYYELLSAGTIRLFDWGKYRWFETLIPLLWLKQRCKEPWITELAKILREQGADYPSFTEMWKRPLDYWQWETHIVNLSMMLKYEALCLQMFGRDDRAAGDAERLWKVLETNNGTVTGLFTGDECLGGRGNNRGTELCAVVELMYSCELLYAATGKGIWADRLEKAAFNALPATISEDMWTHQYDQAPNQIACVTFKGKSFFGTNGPEAHLFGLEPNFGCCTANFNQGWPKLGQNVFLRERGGIVCAGMLPACLTARMKGIPVTVRMETEYPFRQTCRYTVETEAPVAFELAIRIPGWAESALLDGKPVKGPLLRIKRTWKGTTALTLELTSSPRFVKRPHGLCALADGPLVYSLPIKARWEKKEYTRNGVERKFPYCDYELYPESEWAFGFAEGEPVRTERPVGTIPFSESCPPISYKVRVAPVTWEYAPGYETVAAEMPSSRKAAGPVREIEFIPFGASKLRMTELPRIQGNKEQED